MKVATAPEFAAIVEVMCDDVILSLREQVLALLVAIDDRGGIRSQALAFGVVLVTFAALAFTAFAFGVVLVGTGASRRPPRC